MKKRNVFLLAVMIFLNVQGFCQHRSAAWSRYQIDSVRMKLQKDVDYFVRTLDLPVEGIIVEPSYEIYAFGAVSRYNRRYILFNPAFVEQFSFDAMPYHFFWVCCLHEIFHHALGHCEYSPYGRTCAESWEAELACDAGAARSMRKLGFDVATTMYAPEVLLQNVYGTCSHPPKQDRIDEMIKAWWDE